MLRMETIIHHPERIDAQGGQLSQIRGDADLASFYSSYPVNSAASIKMCLGCLRRLETLRWQNSSQLFCHQH